MKKLLAILLAAACAFSLAACAAAPDTPAAEEQPGCISDPTTQQLAAPVEAAMAQYPNEAKYTASNGNFDSEKYDEDWDAWWESYQEKTADMTDPAAMTHWFTTSIPALMQDAGKENRVCSPLNIYMALSMLAAVTDGQTRQQILDALEFDPDWDAEAIQSRMERILYKYFGRNLRSEMDHLGTSRVDLGFFAKLILRPGGLNRLGQAAPEGGVGLRALSRRIFGWREARKDDLRQYAAACFGKSMLTPAELADAERVCCTGHHRGCVLHFTRGEAPENGEAPTREWEQLQEQAERNRAYFRAHLAQNRLEIQRLAQQLQNTILLLQEDGSLRCRAGRVDPALAWRAPSLGDGRVFARQQPNTLGNLIVDILLDASASQNRRQEQLATQGYILVEALTRCAIPVRVLSYCSVSGCTVLREYRDYRENQGNDRIFAFAAAGWNRDGLALRAVDWLLRRSGEQQRLLLVLTDANPNDDTRLPGTGNQVFSRDYSGRPAVADAAEEASALRRHGNPPLCLFSGREGDLSSARAIYGRDVVRLPSVGWFAQTVGKIIQGRLQALES